MKLFGKKDQPVPLTIRDTLFGDSPLENWPPSTSNHKLEPWSLFVRAREALNKKNQETAIQIWRQITEMPNLESRHYLQAWHFLRQHGVQPPPEKAKMVYGVVVEVAVKDGLDLLAVYLDGSTRYYNYSGSGVIWEKPNDSLDPAIQAVLEAGRQTAAQIGPWEDARPPAPTGANARLSMLTPSGLHFGQGGFNVLSNDPISRSLMTAATALMVQLTQLPTQKKS
jgi:hypothetical protein